MNMICKFFQVFLLIEIFDLSDKELKYAKELFLKPYRKFYEVAGRAGLKGRGAKGNFHWRAPVTHSMTSSFVKFVFADSQHSRLLFPVDDYVPAEFTRLLAAFDCKPDEMSLKCKLPLIVTYI